MKRLAGRLAILLALGLAAISSARASEIVCPPNYQASTVRCVDPSVSYCARPAARLASGERLICEYAMLNVAYERIYADQQRMLHAGTLSTADLAAWRRKRNGCETVTCVDEVFADWRRMPARRPVEHPVTARTMASTANRPPTIAPAPAPAPAPALAPTPAPAPMLSPAIKALSVASTAPPPALSPPVRSEPVTIATSAVPARAARDVPPWVLAWLILPVAVLCMCAWVLAHGRGRNVAPTSVRLLADRLHHVSHAAFVLGALAVVNGVMLLIVLMG
ncbi:hypothetical protein [Cupriavidus metallidurans]|uniref:hypothetical protein n=1 Tax=Cupriavidus metallidurans TaxID=119219 RepID=UPI00056520BE|nr:hypothetical protein [Cupriavidus metallidurans]